MQASRGARGMGMVEVGIAVITGGLGFILADGVDRLLATYNPASTDAKPTDKFTSDGAGTLANTLNVAAKPSLIRIGAGVGMTALPAFGSSMVRNPMARAALEGMTVGAGVSLFKTLWNSLVMPLLAPKDTSTASLQKSIIVRLYPAEVAAHINAAQPQVSAASGVLSGPPADVGPFALAGDSSYPDTAQALRAAAGVQDQFPSVQNVWGTGGPGSDYPTAAQVLRAQAGMSAPAGHGTPGYPGVGEDWAPGPPAGAGPGPQAAPHTDPSCGCVGDPTVGYSSFLGDAQEPDLMFNLDN